MKRTRLIEPVDQKCLPTVQKGWTGLVSHIYVDGRLGCIQPIGGAPGDFKPSSNYVYGVGAFLLAGPEVDRLAQGKSAAPPAQTR